MENTRVKVSIIVPIYNVEDYLETCLDSLTGQTLKEIEILIQCIRSSLVPVAVGGRNGRGEDIKTTLLSTEVPPLGGVQMLIQGTGIVLGINSHTLDVGV